MRKNSRPHHASNITYRHRWHCRRSGEHESGHALVARLLDDALHFGSGAEHELDLDAFDFAIGAKESLTGVLVGARRN